MGWTPHTRTELQNAGVQFGVPDTVTNPSPVIVYPNKTGVTDTSNPGTAPFNISNGISARQLQQVQDSIGNQLGSLGTTLANQISNLQNGMNLSSITGKMDSLGSDLLNSVFGLGEQFNSGIQGLQDLIMKNTDKNNEWSAKQAQNQMAFQERMQNIAMEFNAGEAAKNRNWQEMMSNTAHQREVEDLKAAGLNPILSASGGNGASIGSGASASVGMQSGAQGNPDQSGNSALVSLFSALINAKMQMQNANLSAMTNLQMSENQKEASMYGAALAAQAAMRNTDINAEVSREIGQMQSDASRYAAGTSYAAQQYIADNNAAMQQAQLAWNTEHPSNIYQTGASLFGRDIVTGVNSIKETGGRAIRNFVNGIKDIIKRWS